MVENPDVSIESLQVAGADARNDKSTNEVVYLKLSDDLASDARPRVELDGSIMDKAGNELKTAAIPRVEDGINPGVTVDSFSRQLLPDKGESTVTFSADENLAARPLRSTSTSAPAWRSRAAAAPTTRGAVNLPTPSTGTYTFKAGSVTGIYGMSGAGQRHPGAGDQDGRDQGETDEKTKAADVEGQTLELTER